MKILEFIISFVSISNNILADKIICTVVLAISAAIAYKVGGMLGFSGKVGFIGWIVCAALIYIISALIIKGVLWLIQNPICLIGIAGIAILGICITAIICSADRRSPND